MAFLNVAFYRFSPLAEPEAWARRLEEDLRPTGIKGTIILAAEGINGFLAGAEGEVREALERLFREESFRGAAVKESFSDTLPFEKLCLKVKPEIVTFRQQGVDPAAAPRITPEELSGLYENGEDFVIVDTRNDYESKVGAFHGAAKLAIKHFVDLPAVAANFPAEWKQKKMITYCTGGIRCEKAAPYLRTLGYHAYQLDGGILNYFEKIGSKHWEGECFVFDQRVGLLPNLEPSGAFLCAACQGPVPADHGACPHCEA